MRTSVATNAVPEAEPDSKNPIDAYTNLPGIHRTLSFNAKMVGARGQVILEGHDISHMISGFEVTSNVGEATMVKLTLVRLEVITR